LATERKRGVRNIKLSMVVVEKCNVYRWLGDRELGARYERR